MATTYDKASLVMIPSGYKDDKLYAVKPTDGSGDFTFSRDGAGASPATRVNASGLIEKGRENLLTYSNDFSNAAWVKVLSSVTGGQSGYDGSSDAWLLSKSAAGGRIQQSISLTSVNTYSVYAKAGTINWIALNVNFLSGTDPIAYFDLQNGVVGASPSGGIEYKIEAVSNGYYRCSVTSTNGTIVDVRIFPADGNYDTSGTSGNIYIQDAQLEAGLVATDYIETTTAPVSAGLLGDMPRLDYSGGATCPSLLLEPSRVNLLAHSEYLGAWSLDAFGTGVAPVLTANAEISPEGVQNAYEVTFNSGAGTTTGDQSSISLSTSGGQPVGNYTLSFYAKVSSGTEKIVTRHAGGYLYTSINLTDQWQRFEITENLASAGTFGVEIGLRRGLANEPLNSSVTCQIYGIQLESGSYPTSYIPTYGSASTRGADFGESVFTENTLAPTGGTTLFIEFESSGEVDTTPNTGGFYLKNNAGTLSHFGMSFGYGDRIYSNYATGGTIIWDGSIVENTTHKVAFQFTQGGKSFLDGTTKATTSVDWSTKAMGQFEMQYGSKVKQAILFPSILTDAECIALTQI